MCRSCQSIRRCGWISKKYAQVWTDQWNIWCSSLLLNWAVRLHLDRRTSWSWDGGTRTKSSRMSLFGISMNTWRVGCARIREPRLIRSQRLDSTSCTARRVTQRDRCLQSSQVSWLWREASARRSPRSDLNNKDQALPSSLLSRVISLCTRARFTSIVVIWVFKKSRSFSKFVTFSLPFFRLLSSSCLASSKGNSTMVLAPSHNITVPSSLGTSTLPQILSDSRY